MSMVQTRRSFARRHLCSWSHREYSQSTPTISWYNKLPFHLDCQLPLYPSVCHRTHQRPYLLLRKLCIVAWSSGHPRQQTLATLVAIESMKLSQSRQSHVPAVQRVQADGTSQVGHDQICPKMRSTSKDAVWHINFILQINVRNPLNPCHAHHYQPHTLSRHCRTWHI